MSKKGTLFLLPTVLADDTADHVLAPQVKNCIAELDYFIVENARTARRFIKALVPEKVIEQLDIRVIDKNSSAAEVEKVLKPVLDGKDAGILSEAGCPGVADPGAEVVKYAHKHEVKVVPLVGPSSLLLALMASGFNGQSFAFHGYLPIEKGKRVQAIKNLEKEMQQKDQTQLFIETPYRNQQLLEDLLKTLSPSTRLCIAANVTAPNEFIKTDTVANWKKIKVDLHKQPAVFLFYR
ncbi:MAG: SAM-dependent methyltransferase [Hymenobacteraceae bacterium]|nr:SAM-dependent methyltransferase [Hymenobacteraceae bacterium]MDX5394592.1 SAM-dependent methyltransferase [Hymenobacteraceae bacterium]MDX5443153.1 SAM-dependent methyltransferase [Hymenobacteraceae bacterium]MDX5510620.1 SAM-dependent methyltransferase [Hymenobacteraceae bacterium]